MRTAPVSGAVQARTQPSVFDACCQPRPTRAAGAFPVALDAAALIGRSAEIGGRVAGRRHPLHRREDAIVGGGLFAPAIAARAG